MRQYGHMRRVHVIISGRVQGVGFRYHTRQKAERLGLVGWVRDSADGTVEVEAEGVDDSLRELLAWLNKGPAGAHVRDVDVTDIDPTGGTDFDVRF